MSSSFVHAPKTNVTTGTQVDAWLEMTWDKAHFLGDEMIVTETGSVPLSKAAVVFRNFRSATGTPGAYFADPVSIVEYRGAMLASMSHRFTYPSVRSSDTTGLTDVVVPLGTPVDIPFHTSEESADATLGVLRQAARNWVTGGYNRGDMSSEHVIALYYSALQALVFATGTAHTKETQSKWLCAVYALARAFASLCKMYPAAMRVSEALVYTHGVNDMLQKALAHVFIGTPIDLPTGYEMMATIVRRNLRNSKIFTGLVPGPFVVFLLTPLLTGILDGSTTLEDLQERFNVRGAALVADLEAIHATHSKASSVDGIWHRIDPKTHRTIAYRESGDKLGYQAECLAAQAKAANLPLSVEQSRNLLIHCTTTDASAPVPWADWGILPAPPKLSCRVSTGRYGIHHAPLRYHDPVTFSSRICSLDDHTFEVFGYKGVEWSGFQFHTPGTYTIHAHDLGIAKAAVGDTRGEELTANWRLTIGNVVLPRDERGYSLSGMHFSTYGGAKYIKCKPLRLDAPFQVIVELNLVRLCQDGECFCVLERKKNKDALLAFKNVWFRVEFAPPVSPVPPARAVPATYGGSRTTTAAATAAPTPFGTWASVVTRSM